MNKLDPHTLFSIFEQGDEQIYKEHDLEGILDNPYVLIGMTVTGVENFHIIDSMYTIRYGEKYLRVRESIQLKYYSKLFKYLHRIQLPIQHTTYTVGEDYNTLSVIDSLTELQVFFLHLEDYHKVDVIGKFTDLLTGKILDNYF